MAAAAASVAGLAAGVPEHAARAASAPGAPAGVPPAPRGWQTVFSDDFTGPAGAAPSSAWRYDTGPGSSFGNNEVETMTSARSNVYLDGSGNLDITALDNGGEWTSGRIQTAVPVAGAPAGGELEVTASIKQPNPANGLGYWPAFWMLGPGQWPENGEIDIMEDVNAGSELSGTVHCGTYPGGPCDEPVGIGSKLRPCPGCQSGYHTYSEILDRANPADQSITFYLDGRAYFSATENEVGTATWQDAFDHIMSIIFDLAIGGSYPDAVCACSTPASSTNPGQATSSGGTMSVAYVAAYETGHGVANSALSHHVRRASRSRPRARGSGRVSHGGWPGGIAERA